MKKNHWLYFIFVISLTACTSLPAEHRLLGLWGGEHIQMMISKTGVDISYDCAEGKILTTLSLDPEGHFSATGTHHRLLGGSVSRHHQREYLVDYLGTIKENQLELTVKVHNSEQVLGIYHLLPGAAGRLVRCR